MPVYEYACTDCGQDLEVRQSFTDDALTVCPSCAGRLRKVLSAVGVVFKGSGFYRNDSRAPSPGDGGGGDKKEAASEGAVSKDSSPKDASSKEPVGAGSPATSGATKSGASSATDSRGGSKGPQKSAASSSTSKAARNPAD